MKVVYISEGNLPSKEANSIQVAQMAQALSQKVDEFELVTLGDKWSFFCGRKFDFYQWYGLTQEFKITQMPLLCKAEYPFPHKYRNKFRHKYFSRCGAFYAKLRTPNLVYTRSCKAATTALKLGLAVLLEWHLPIKDEFFRRRAFTEGRFLGVVTISQQLAQEYTQGGLPTEKVLVEHDGVDLERFLPCLSKEEARRRLALPLHMPIVVYAGHLYDFKGIPMLYEVAHRMPHCQFVLVGGWENDVEQARQYCRSNSLTNVQVIGHVPQPEVPMYLCASDILVLPNSGKHAWSETTSPLKLFEYMAARRPIVASALSNIKTVLQNRFNALLVEPDCSKSFVEAIGKLLKEPLLEQALANQAFEDVKYYTWERRAERIIEFAINRHQEPTPSYRSFISFGKG